MVWLIVLCITKLSAQNIPFIINPVRDNIISGTPIILSTNLNLIRGNEIVITKNDNVADIHRAGNTYPIGFSFNFFQSPYDYFNVGSNGYITFQIPPWPQHLPFSIPPGASPQQQAPKNCILGPIKNYDYESKPGTYAFYKTIGNAPNQQLIVYWCNVPVMKSSETATFQIVLNEDNSIENHLIYLPYSDYAGNRATQGIVNQDGTISFPDALRNNHSWIPFTGLRNNTWKYTPDQSGTNYSVDTNGAFNPVLIPEYIIWYEAGITKPIGYETQLIVWPKKTTTYRAEVFTCWNYKIDEASVTIKVIDFLVDAFNPNSNIPANKTFGISTSVSAIGLFTLQVYNRWGQKVFQTSDPNHRWNGKMNNTGRDCPIGVYPWVLIVNIDNNPITNRGTVTLVR